MKSKITDLSGVNKGDIICSICIAPNKKWIRTIDSNNGDHINIYKMIVERSLKSGKIWILCLYSDTPEDKHIFHLDLEKVKVRIWSKP